MDSQVDIPFFSIITPTLERESLVECCRSVDAQTFKGWEHIVAVDDCWIKNPDLHERYSATRKRWVESCGVKHEDYGNTCRHEVWNRCKGVYVIYLDDDNTLAYPDALLDMGKDLCRSGKEHPWAIFPILRHGHRFFADPPGNCHTDTANMVIRREFAQWPAGPEYTMDGIFCERLKAEHPNYASFPSAREIINMPVSNEGRR